MGKATLSQVKYNIDRYCEGKNKLQNVLACSNVHAKMDHEKSICQAEQELEQAFANLLYSNPGNLSELLSKSRLFIEDILLDAELTQYQTLALQCIIDDLTALQNKTENLVKQNPSPKNMPSGLAQKV